MLQAGHGDPSAEAKLAAVVWDQLHRLAQPSLNHGWFPPAELVNDLWHRLVNGMHMPPECHHRFLLIAARAMRSILTDDCLRSNTDNGLARKLLLDMVRLDAALKELSRIDERTARIVELRYFAGLSTDEAATALGVAPAVASQQWRDGRAWLCRRFRQGHTNLRGTAAA
jgi:RNA polymerase sigma factor (TIGR02999 family)